MELKVIGEEKVGKIKFTGIEGGFGQGKKAMLVSDIARIHHQPLKEINRRINNNRKQFIDGVDVVDLLSGSEPLRKFAEENNLIGSNRTQHVYMLSERGYLKLLKIMDDDKAWDIYNDIVDNYFNMRVAIKKNKPAIVNQERLAIMKDNSATRRANMLYKIAMATDSTSSKEALLAKAAEVLTGEMTIPVMKVKYYSAGEVGKKLSISAQKVGKIANRLGLKAEQPSQNKYGRWANSKSRYSDKEVPQWLYTDEGIKAVKKELEK